jgi:hypothetical protein
MTDWPYWLLKLTRRLLGLEPGTYQIILHKTGAPRWSITKLGKFEG